jgi:two-component system, OmpR family, sensor histidine kinase ResE
MNETPPEKQTEITGIFKHIHHLGSATESVFSRIYKGLNHRRELERELKRRKLMIDMKKAQNDNLRYEQENLKRNMKERGTELERLYGILGSIDEGIIMQDPNGNVTMMNHAAEEMLGSKKAFWDGPLGSLFNEFNDVTDITSELMPLGESEKLPLNNRIVQAQVVAIGDNSNQRIGTIIILRDVTRDALAERLKDGFVTHISHELKTPMTVIKLAGELLSAQPEDAPANRKMLEKLVNNVDVLDRLVLELLDISEMSAGTFDVQRNPVSIEEMIWSVANGINFEIKDRDIELFVMIRDMDRVMVEGDDKRLQWALGHLIRNGAFYSEKGSYIGVSANVEELNEQEYVAIRVRDDGAGISDQDLPHIFERFYRGDARTVEGKKFDPRGLGQGLFVAKTISEVHGGFLGVKTEVGVGSVFTMALPVIKEPALPDMV